MIIGGGVRRRSGRDAYPGCCKAVYCGTDFITSVPKASWDGLARSAKCLICRAADPASSRVSGTEVLILSLTDQAVKLIEKERRVGFPSEKN
jgi:hypothetical protein